MFIYYFIYTYDKIQSKTNFALNITKMMQSQDFTPSWPLVNSTIDQLEPYGFNMGVHFDASSSFHTSVDSFFSNENFPFSPYDFDDDLLRVTVPWEDISAPLAGLDSMLTDGVEESFPLSSQRQDIWSPCPSIRSSEASTDTMLSPLTMPILGEDAMEIDNQLPLFHLLKAHGDATEKNQTDLSEVILRCVSEKGNPVGETLERIAFNLSQDIQNQNNYYLMQESSKNFEVAFRTFYQIFPYGRFAHFAANSAILEAIPNDAEQLHIIDFDLGTLRLTSIKWGDDHSPGVEEMGIHDLVNEFMAMKKQGGGTKEWLAFNCMVGLPHIGKNKSRKLVNEFLGIAKQLLTSCGDNARTTKRGIITLGEGDACENLKDGTGSSFGAYFNAQLMHYQAIMESMESNMAKHLVQARLAMECLFVGPNICAQAWFQKWKEMNETCYFQAGTTLEGLKVSRGRVMEAKEMVKERGNSYEVSIGGDSGNELTLDWRGITLVKVSSWRN
ncbi:hypothetical protein ES288_D04G164700v1 [Gossypium darwinii]|uniref:Uncharacterized protein n=1 Tax=Gossypium darwinii TaxID=34276 RepID=A0A5D2D1R0_GOSDA|nr:hypothetical protein ES288_D04G164700v1 [Gossypium darwinii]